MEALKLKAKNVQEEPVQLSDYYEIGDCVSLLEKMRTYQITDIMSRMGIAKYKLF